MLEASKKYFPMAYVHACPFFGYHEAYNVSADITDIGLQFLQGVYKLNTRLYDDLDDNIGSTESISELLYQ
jgi:hypothetical protein